MSNAISRCQETEPEALVEYLYDELPPEARARVEAHLALCASCRAELEALREVRGDLAAWSAPAPEPGFAALSRGHSRSWRWMLPAGLAAAAVLVLAAAASIANLEIRYDRDGFSVRTGWARDSASPSTPERAAATVPAAAAAVAEAAPAGASARPWRDDLAALEERLRAELAQASGARTAAAARDGDAGRSMPDAELLRRVRALIQESEQRQQRELAVRMAQLARDFDSQRQTDLVRIQQGLGQLEGSTAADRQLLNYLVRVSQRK